MKQSDLLAKLAKVDKTQRKKVVYLPRETHDALKAFATTHGVPMSRIVDELVIAFLTQPKRGKR